MAFRLQRNGSTSPITTGEPSYMASAKTPADYGMTYRLLAPAPNAPDSIAANVIVQVGEFLRIRGTVFNSQLREGEISLIFPNRKYQQNGQQRTAYDVNFSRESRDALAKAIHSDLESGNVEGSDSDSADESGLSGEGAGELPDAFNN